MPEYTQTEIEKIELLRSIEGAQVFELARINWGEPDGAIYYAVTQIDHLCPDLPVAPVEARLIAEDYPGYFLPISSTSGLGDEEVDLKFWDGDGAFSDLVHAHGEGIAVEMFYYFPQVDLLLSHWWGHLRTAEGADSEHWTGKAANGFRSPNLPMPGRAHWKECQAIFGRHLDTLEEIAANDCPYNAHLPGGTVGNEAHETCDRLSPASCTARGVHPLFHLSHQSAETTVLNGQTSGPQLMSVSRGNESNLKEPVRVVMGQRRIADCQVLAYRRDYNNNNPDKGFFDAIYEVCEGPVQGFQAVVVQGKNADALHYAYRLGNLADPPITNLTTHGYSGTAIIRYNFGWVNPGTVSPANMRAWMIVSGLRNIREYSDEDTFTLATSRNRAWQIGRMLTDKRWGFGLDYARLDINSFIETAEWGYRSVRFTTPEGAIYDHVRSRSDVELVGRTAQQQIEDMCLAGRFSRPFLFQGKLHIVPLRALTTEELAACPVFTDSGSNRNIIVDADGKSSLTRSQISDLDLPNRVEGTYHDENKDWMESVAAPAEDIEQQLRAGRVLGDTSRRQVTKKYSFLGVTQEGAAVKLAHGILRFGEFDEGGLKNNLRLKFKIWLTDALYLHENKVIKVVSNQLTRYGFKYFRIIKKRRAGNLHFEIEAQAFNNEALLAFETVQSGPVINPGEIPPHVPGEGNPNIPNPICPLDFGDVRVEGDMLRIPVLPC